MTKRFKIKGLGLLAILFLLVPLSLYGGINVEKVMREFQARYYYVCTNFYIWPDCYGGPAPSYPKDGFYGDIEEDPELGVRLVNSLKTAFEDGLYTDFYKSSFEGKTNYELPDSYTSNDFQFPTVTVSNYMSVLKQIEDSIYLLTYPMNGLDGVTEISINATSEDPLGCDAKEGIGDNEDIVFSCFCSEAASIATNRFSGNDWFVPAHSAVGIGMTNSISHTKNPDGDYFCQAYVGVGRGKLYGDFTLRSEEDQMEIYVLTYPAPDGFLNLPSCFHMDQKYHLFETVPGGGIYYSQNFGTNIPTDFPFPSGSETDYYSSKGWCVRAMQVLTKPKWNTRPDETDCCTCGSFGSFNAGVTTEGQLSFGFNLGETTGGKRAGILLCQESLPSAKLFQLSSLRYYGDGATASAYLYGSSWQRTFSQGKVVITSTNSTQYSVNFYLSDNTPLKTITVGKYNNNTNQLQIVETTGNSSRTKLFTYNASEKNWTMEVDGTDVRHVSSSVWNGTNRVVTFKSLNGTNLISQTTEVRALFPWGKELVSRTRGTGTNALTETWTYYSTTNLLNTNNYGRLAAYMDENGYWERYEYGTNGLISKKVTQMLNLAITSADTANNVTTYTYTANGTNPPTRLEVIKCRNYEVGRNYRVWNGNIRKDIVCQTVGAGLTATNNLVTQTTYIPGEYPLKVSSVLHPDGTQELYSYVTNGIVTETVQYSDIKTETIKNELGQVLSSSTMSLNGDILLSAQTNVLDSLGRVIKTTYLDGTETSRSNVFCGVKWEKDKEGVVTHYDYDQLRRLVKTTRNGVCTSNVLDADGNILLSIRFPTNNYAARQTNFTASYDTAGRKILEGNGMGQYTRFNYTTNVNFRIEETIEGYGTSSAITNKVWYFKDGRPYRYYKNGEYYQYHNYGATSGSLITYNYLESGNATESTRIYTDIAGRDYKTIYSSTSIYDEETYNEKGQKIRSRDADGVVTLYQYNTLGELEYTAVDVNTNGVIDFNGTDRITRNVRSYLAGGKTRRETYVWGTNNVDSATKISTVDSDSLSQQTILWNGSSSITNRTETEYQPSAGISRRVTVTKADGTKSISEYENGLLARMIEKDANGGIVTQTSYGYDSYGRQNTITDLRNGTTTVTYDAADRVVTTTNPLSLSTTNHYDILGRVWKVDYPDGGSLTNVYDTKGNLALSYGSRQFPVGYGYDRLGRVTSMTNWTEYPGSGARVTTWTYSNRGFLERKTCPNQDCVAYTYTPGGRVEKKMIQTPFGTGFTNHVINLYNYNTAGDLKSVSYSSWLTPGITNTYNRLGLLENIVQGTNTTTRSYDHAGQLLSETYTGGTLNGFSVNYSYDSLMRLSQLRVPGVLTNTCSYDTAGRVSSLSNGNYSAQYSYITNSPLISSVTHKQGSTARLTVAMGYDQLNRMTNITSTPSGSTNVFAYTSLYNAVNQRTKTTLADDSYWDYTYDDLGQVTSGRRYTADGVQITSRQSVYDLDEIGNRVTSSTPGYVPYTVNDDNQYTIMRDVSLTYDVAGNVNTYASWTYSWDNENRLIQVVSTSKLIKFSYDTQGRRIEKKVWNNTTGTGTPATYLKYLYDGWNLIAELNGKSSDAVVRTYSWGPEAQGEPGTLRMIADNNGVYFPAYDPNGNVMGLVKASDGTVCAQYEYLPYGEQVTATGTMAGSNPIRFSTKYYDTEARLYYYGYRYYSPDMGRWLSRDPIEEQGGLNLYGFVNNDPVNGHDMLGLWKIERKRREFAIARAEQGDTFDNLGQLLHLDTEDYKAWAHTDDNYPRPGCMYKIPNTIFIEFGKKFKMIDIFGPIPPWQRDFKKKGKMWKEEGFKVVLTNPSNPELAKSHLKSEYIYGFVYAGHGGGEASNGKSSYEIVFKEAETSDEVVSLAANRYTLYGISFLYAYGCGLASRFPVDPKHIKLGFLHSEWEYNVAKRGYFEGTWGDVTGYSTFERIINTPGTNYRRRK
ncbi:MAG: RHS repeat protein [Verrucomicrobia bacterium]|nr:RHS repeat protein [Verrucomicrobiota bacterium]